MKRLGFLLLLFWTTTSLAVSPAETTDLENTLNRVFAQQIQELGYQGFEIFADEKLTDYAGGVNITNGKIRFLVGSKILQKYPIEAFRFISCHELGHLLAGAPYKTGRQYEGKLISSEGQSDYWAGKTCLPELVPSPVSAALEFFIFMSASLNDIVGDNPFYSTPVIGQRDDYFYNGEYSSFQCRLNTVEAGARHLPRPGCWYRE